MTFKLIDSILKIKDLETKGDEMESVLCNKVIIAQESLYSETRLFTALGYKLGVKSEAIGQIAKRDLIPCDHFFVSLFYAI